MKKIVSALLALALVGSVAVAEVKTAAQVEVDTSLFSVADVEDMDAATYFGANALTDSKMTFSVDTGVAGATFQMKVISQEYVSDSKLTVDVSDFAKTKLTVTKKTALLVAPGDLYGWVKLGDVSKLTLGSFTSRNANRLTGALDTYKYGYSQGYNTAKLAEADKLTNAVVDFYVGPFTLQLQPVASAKDDFNIGGRVFGSFDGLANVTVTANYNGGADSASSSTILGAYADITAIENLGIVVGYSGFLQKDKNVNAAELRLQYKADALTVSNHNNFSFGKEWYAFYNGVGLSYKANDKITAKITVDNYTGKSSAEAKDYNKLIINPNFVYTVEKNATISSGVAITTVKDGATSINVPFTLQIKY